MELKDKYNTCEYCGCNYAPKSLKECPVCSDNEEKKCGDGCGCKGRKEPIMNVCPDYKEKKKLRITHIPQIPGKAFTVEVDSPEEASKLLAILAAYDQFQYQNNIKGDFCNVGSLVEWYEDKDNPEENGWCDWYSEDGDELKEWEIYNNIISAYWEMLIELNDIKF